MRLFELISNSEFRQHLPAITKTLVADFGNDMGLEFELYNAFVEEYGDAMEEEGIDTDPYEISGELQNHPEWLERFHARLPRYLEEKAWEAYYNVIGYAESDNGVVTLYRVIAAPSDWYSSGGLTARDVGIYWSFRADAAEAHWGDFANGAVTWRLTATAPIANIDWVSTIVQNTTMEEEEEIRIIAKTPLKVILVEYHDDATSEWHPVDHFNPVMAVA